MVNDNFPVGANNTDKVHENENFPMSYETRKGKCNFHVKISDGFLSIDSVEKKQLKIRFWCTSWLGYKKWYFVGN